jgi:hypothetical protein
MNVLLVATLAGWSLIVPPLSQNNQVVEKNAPLARWEKVDTFDSDAACNKELDKLTALLAGNVTYTPIQSRVLAGKCIAADDPRIHSDNYEAY